MIKLYRKEQPECLFCSKMRSKLILGIIPLAFLLCGFIFREIASPYAQRSIDPEYIYFISALSMGSGIPDVAHIDNPGTPLQVLGAIVFRGVWLFEANGKPFAESVLTQSDSYLSWLNISLSLILFIGLYWAGRKTYLLTQSISTALLIQTAPLIPGIWFSIAGRVTPELLFPLPALLLSILILTPRDAEKPIAQLPLKLALIHAFGLSIKLTWAPLLILTPFLLRDKKDWLRFIVFIVPATALMCFPVLFRFAQFKNWVKNLFLHSGRYGSGEAEIVNSDTFWQGLSDIIRMEPWMMILLGLAGISIAGRLLRKKSGNVVLIGLSLAMLAGVVMVAKHFEHRYLIPVILMIPVLIVLLVKEGYFFSEKLLVAGSKEKLMAGILLLLLIRAIPHGLSCAETLQKDRAKQEVTQAFVKSLPAQRELIISSQAYGAPFPEYALAYSVSWAGPEGEEYQKILGKYFPATWQYFTWDKRVRKWGKTQLGVNPIFIYMDKWSEDGANEALRAVKPDLNEAEGKIRLLFLNGEEGIGRVDSVRY